MRCSSSYCVSLLSFLFFCFLGTLVYKIKKLLWINLCPVLVGIQFRIVVTPVIILLFGAFATLQLLGFSEPCTEHFIHRGIGGVRPTLYTVLCDEEEAELFIPFDHELYIKSEKEAMKRFGVSDRFDIKVEYWNDPDYLFDWTEGEFS